MTQKPVMAQSARRNGRATRCLAPKPVTMRHPTCITDVTHHPGHDLGFCGTAYHAGAPGDPPADPGGTVGRCGLCDLRPPPDESDRARDRPDGPGHGDQRWQGQAANGFAAARCVIDWDATYAICPQGQRSVVWMERPDRHGHATVRIAFSKPVCAACASRADCTRAATAPRALRIRERDHYTVLQAARARQQTETFKKVYARRAGIEGTIAQGTRTGRSATLTLHRVCENPAHASAGCRRDSTLCAWQPGLQKYPEPRHGPRRLLRSPHGCLTVVC